MANVTIIDPVEDPRWDKFVENHPFGWICHLSAWKQALNRSFQHMRGHYFALLDDTNHHIKAGMPVFEVKSWLTGNRLVSIPFATLCDPLVSTPEELDVLVSEGIRLMSRCKASHLEIRSLHATGLNNNKKLDVWTYYKHHYLQLDKDPEKLMKTFHRSCVRQRISRAVKSMVTVKVGYGEKDLKDFYRLYLLTRRRLALPPQPYHFFKNLWEAFSPVGKMAILLAEVKGYPIAGLILFKYKNRVSAECAGSDERYNDLSPNHLLFWEAIRSAWSEGFKIFDFGRTSPLSESLMEFKNRWGTTVMDISHYYCPPGSLEKVEKKEFSISYRLMKKICEKAPFFAFESIGRFCYRHLG